MDQNNALSVQPTELEKLEQSQTAKIEEPQKRLTAIGITKKNKSPLKRQRKIAEKSKKINRNKKRHHKTQKEKKH